MLLPHLMCLRMREFVERGFLMEKCLNCGADNPEGAQFCGRCGASLARPAPGGSPPQSVPPQGPQGAPPPPIQEYGASPPPPPPGPLPPYPAYPPVQQNSGKATASLILGIVGIFVCPLICSVLAIILGSQAKKEIEASGGMLGGMSMANAGLILGIVGLVIYLITIVIWVVVALVSVARESSLFLYLPFLAGWVF